MSPPVLVYDFNPNGHCPGWLHLTAAGFRATGTPTAVACATGDPRVAPWADALQRAGCTVLPIPPQLDNHAAHASALASDLGTQRIFLPNFDSMLYEMGKLGLQGAFHRLDVGGIWLRPDLEGETPGWWQRLRMKVVRSRAHKLARRHLRAIANNRRGLAALTDSSKSAARLRLFFTSPDAIRETTPYLPAGAALPLCDPWLHRASESRAAARATLGIPAETIVLLHTGTSRPEKGLADTCKALLQLPDALLARLCLLRAGQVDPLDAASLAQLHSRCKPKVIDRFLDEAELARCYAAADWVLLPYRDQKESSGVLVHAAANHRPVVASDFGRIGHAVRTHDLGRLFRHRDVGGLARVLADLAEKPVSPGTAGMEAFAALNSPQTFQQTLVDGWLKMPADPPAPCAARQ